MKEENYKAMFWMIRIFLNLDNAVKYQIIPLKTRILPTQKLFQFQKKISLQKSLNY